MNQAQIVLTKALGKYEERIRVLSTLSRMISNLDENDGYFSAKLNTLRAVVSNISPGLFQQSGSVWEEVEELKLMVKTIKLMASGTLPIETLEQVSAILGGWKSTTGKRTDIIGLVEKHIPAARENLTK